MTDTDSTPPPVPATEDGDAAYKQRWSVARRFRKSDCRDRPANKVWSSCTTVQEGEDHGGVGHVLRSLGHGHRVAIVQFIKGAWEPAETARFRAMGRPDRISCDRWWVHVGRRRTVCATRRWRSRMGGGAGLFDGRPAFKLVLLDEVNGALRKDYVSVEQVLDGIERRPANIMLSDRTQCPMSSSSAQISLPQMTLIKHPLEAQESSCTGRDRVFDLAVKHALTSPASSSRVHPPTWARPRSRRLDCYPSATRADCATVQMRPDYVGS